MKQSIACTLAVLMLLGLTGCRRRMDPNGERLAQETVFQPQPAPIAGQGQQVRDPDLAPDPERTQKERNPRGNTVDETVAAQGGETLPDGPEAPEAGQEITVSLDPMGGTCTRDSVRVRAGGVYGVLPVPEREGMNFQGWFRQETGGKPVNEVTLVFPERDHTLYAHWSEKREFTLTFDPNGGRISPYSAEKKIYPGDLYGELPEPMYSGYRFCGWFTEPEGGEQVLPADMVTVTGDQTLYAMWEYSPVDYWTFVLKNTKEKLYTCQQVRAYLELEAQGTTMASCGLLTDAGAENIGAALNEDSVSDDWVLEMKPEIVVELTGNMGLAQAIKAAAELRFPTAQVAVFPREALDGSPEEQLYYKLYLAKICYPQLLEDVDMTVVARELGVTGSVVSD